jgi:CheY-like chemotaxis protein
LTPSNARDAQTDVQWTKRASILLVEDDVLVRYTAADLLRSHGHEVVEAAHGEEAKSLLASGLVVDLVLSDVAMPKVDGIRLTELIRKDYPGLPVILVSSSYSPDIANLHVPFLPKPYSVEQLLDAIRRVVQRSG